MLILAAWLRGRRPSTASVSIPGEDTHFFRYPGSRVLRTQASRVEGRCSPRRGGGEVCYFRPIGRERDAPAPVAAEAGLFALQRKEREA